MGAGKRRRHLRDATDQPAKQPEKQRQYIRGREIDLGDLGGEDVEDVLATFRWYGQQFMVNPDLSEVELIDLFDEADQVKVTDPRQMSISKDFVAAFVHPDDFERFWDLAREKRRTVQDLMELCWKIVDLVSENPTAEPSDSLAGQQPTKQSSPAGSSVRDVAQRFVEKFEAEGRPDKAAQVMLAIEAREAAEGASVAATA